MKEIEISGFNRSVPYTKTRAASRAVILREGQILLSHETLQDTWLIPGGGLETGETPEACVRREVEEETGLLVRPLRHFLTLYEYYEDVRYISFYFLCEGTGTGQMHLTVEEKQRGVEPGWLSLEEALAFFSSHAFGAARSEEERGACLREYTALLEYLKTERDILPVCFGDPGEIGCWMDLVRSVRGTFPGLETEEALEAHRGTVLRFMGKQQALCVRCGEEIAGVLLFSRSRNMICCLAVAPHHRRKGIASMLLSSALREMDRSRAITVSTFREGDEKGTAPRALYRKFGFQPAELTEEFGYPNQVFVLPGTQETQPVSGT